jgi:hypothetical protein
MDAVFRLFLILRVLVDLRRKRTVPLILGLAFFCFLIYSIVH